MTTNNRIDPADTKAVLTHLEAQIEHIPKSRHEQPTRLLDARTRAESEREKALTEEPWAAVMTGFPTVNLDGELTGMLPMPTIDGKELFGTRLAFDLLGCCANEAQVQETLDEYFSMIREPDHLFLVAFAALDTIANHVMPALLETLEQQASDFESRVRLADAARNAWKARVNDLRGSSDQAADGADE